MGFFSSLFKEEKSLVDRANELVEREGGSILYDSWIAHFSDMRLAGLLPNFNPATGEGVSEYRDALDKFCSKGKDAFKLRFFPKLSDSDVSSEKHLREFFNKSMRIHAMLENVMKDGTWSQVGGRSLTAEFLCSYWDKWEKLLLVSLSGSASEASDLVVIRQNFLKLILHSGCKPEISAKFPDPTDSDLSTDDSLSAYIGKVAAIYRVSC